MLTHLPAVHPAGKKGVALWNQKALSCVEFRTHYVENKPISLQYHFYISLIGQEETFPPG
jgi:hypothetical protein